MNARFSWTRTRAICVKELRDLRRNRITLVTMAMLPAIFIVLPLIQLLRTSDAVPGHQIDVRIGLSMLYMLIIPTFVPSALSGYSIVGEREQGTLEPVLTTPLRSVELLVGKALAALGPTLLISYAVFGVFLLVAALFAAPVVSTAVFAGSHVVLQVVFIPLLAGWAIWVGMALSARSSDVRVAQQLSVLASLPPLVLVALISLGVIQSSLALALGVGGALLIIDVAGWLIVARLFNRERLITGQPARTTH